MAYEAAHSLFLSAQAGYLAAGLEEGTPGALRLIAGERSEDVVLLRLAKRFL